MVSETRLSFRVARAGLCGRPEEVSRKAKNDAETRAHGDLVGNEALEPTEGKSRTWGDGGGERALREVDSASRNEIFLNSTQMMIKHR